MEELLVVSANPFLTSWANGGRKKKGKAMPIGNSLVSMKFYI